MLLGVPLLPLLAVLQLGEQSLPVGFIQLHNALQLLHEEQLQHALVRVQVCQLEQLPLQDVVVPGVAQRVTVAAALPCVRSALLSLTASQTVGHESHGTRGGEDQVASVRRNSPN